MSAKPANLIHYTYCSHTASSALHCVDLHVTLDMPVCHMVLHVLVAKLDLIDTSTL